MVVDSFKTVDSVKTDTGITDKYDPKGPFNIGQYCINQTQPFRTYNTNNTIFLSTAHSGNNRLEQIWTQSCRLL